MPCECPQRSLAGRRALVIFSANTSRRRGGLFLVGLCEIGPDRRLTANTAACGHVLKRNGGGARTCAREEKDRLGSLT
jgi:hypothetical protein